MPSWINGMFVRNGPSVFTAQGKQLNHFFDGMAMLHGFRFVEGRVTYVSRLLRSEASRSFLEGSLKFQEFGTGAKSRDFFSSLFGSPGLTDNASVNVAKVGGDYLALTETPRRIQFDLETLETVGAFDFQKVEQAGVIETLSTAHPQYDPQTKEMFFLSTEFSAISKYHFFKFANGSYEQVCSLPVVRPAYNHSFGLTSRYLILIECPYKTFPLKISLLNRGLAAGFRWQPGSGTRMTIIDRGSGAVIRKAELDPFFFFHIANSFEEGNEVFVDIVEYKDPSLIQQTFFPVDDHFKTVGKTKRYKISVLGKGSPSSEILSNCAIEFPRIYYDSHNTQKYRFLYGLTGGSRHFVFNSLVKFDLSTGEITSWEENESFPSEPTFIPNGEAKEGRGVLVSIVLNRREQNSFLLILDAESFHEMARLKLPHPIPFGLHGQFFAH